MYLNGNKKRKKNKIEQENSSDTSAKSSIFLLLTCAIWSNLPKSWLRVDTSSEADSFSDNGVKLTMSAYKMLQQNEKIWYEIIQKSYVSNRNTFLNYIWIDDSIEIFDIHHDSSWQFRRKNCFFLERKSTALSKNYKENCQLMILKKIELDNWLFIGGRDILIKLKGLISDFILK